MGTYREEDGDLIMKALNEEFDVILHGVNCFCTQGSGLAPLMVKAFGTDKFPMEGEEYRGDVNKLGCIDYQTGGVVKNKFKWAKSNNIFLGMLAVVNCYSQYSIGQNTLSGSPVALDYEALTMCLRKINSVFKGMIIGVPAIGCGLAGGIWDINQLSPDADFDFNDTCFKDVKTIIQTELRDCNVVYVNYVPVPMKLQTIK